MASKQMTFPNNENPLTDGGAGPNAVENTVTATWNHPIVATAGSPGHILGPSSAGTNDSIARYTGNYWTPDQIMTGTVYSVGTVGAAEIELHTRMTMVPVSASNDLVFTYEYDFQPTIMALAYWGGTQGDFHILFNPTITELADGDAIRITVKGQTKNVIVEAFINGVSQGTGLDTAGVVPIQGNPGIGLDNDTGVYGWKGVTAFAPTPDDYSFFPKRMLADRFEGVQAASIQLRRNPARPWNGQAARGTKLWRWLQKHPKHRVSTGTAIYPKCNAIRWFGHGQRSWNPTDEKLLGLVHRLPSEKNHPRVRAASARGLNPAECGQCLNMAGHPVLVAPGEHLVMYPEGPVHHGVQDISSYYETTNILEARRFTHVPKYPSATRYQGARL